MTEFNENDEQAVAADQQTNLPGNGLSLQHTTTAADELARSSVGSKPSSKSVTTMTAKQSSATSTTTQKWTPAACNMTSFFLNNVPFHILDQYQTRL